MSAERGRPLEGRVAVITGAGGGIGRATSLLFATAGARVLLADARRAELEETASQVRAGGGEAAVVTGDLVSPSECEAVPVAAVSAFGRLDILFNNAGVGTLRIGGTVETIPLESWDLALDVNLRAIYLTSRAAIPHMRANGGGSIINTASGAAWRVGRDRPSHAYAASKGGVLSLTKAMAATYGKECVRVNAICPGLIRTALTVDIVGLAERAAAEGRGAPLGRVGEPEDIAKCALFLASDDSSYITGAQIVVDGGADVVG